MRFEERAERLVSLVSNIACETKELLKQASYESRDRILERAVHCLRSLTDCRILSISSLFKDDPCPFTLSSHRDLRSVNANL
jgi:7,8-dihydro-6-hydroxymethylpterin-pyrophosphokinase